jgi:quinolinate synthase
MDGYIHPALDELGDSVMLLAHFYMGGEIVKLVERYGGHIADSYQLALQAVRHPETKVFVESAVHFMAEAIALLAAPDQRVYITNPRSGCTLEMMAKEFMVRPAFDALQERYGDDLLVVAYMNTSGRLKALAGRSGGAVCTSANAAAIMRWAQKRSGKILFVPDQHLGRNVAKQVGIEPDRIFALAAGHDGGDLQIDALPQAKRDALDRAEMILWGSFCGVHTVFTPQQIEHWRGHGYSIQVHPECPREVVDLADGAGSTSYLWNHVMDAAAGSKIAVATEGHFVRNLREQAAERGIEVVHLADAPGAQGDGCSCATMSRNDPPHLVAVLDLLRRDRVPEINLVLPGDMVDELSGFRERLDEAGQAEVREGARLALERMIEITEAAK